MLTRRQMIATAALAPLATVATTGQASTALKSLTGAVKPISVDERRQRIAKIQDLMARASIGAILIEAGSTLDYFTGIRWNRSERVTAAVIPAKGEPAIVTPGFEEPSVRETLAFGDDVRAWQEHENPFARIAGILADRGVASAKLAIEPTLRFFIVDGMRQAAPGVDIVSGADLVRACRLFKSPAELELMRVANAVTLAAIGHVRHQIRPGMTSADISSLMAKASVALGGAPGFALVLLNEASAYPHGSGQKQVVREGSVVLMDCGTTVEGYQSDISRTFIYGAPNARQRKVWAQVKRGQELALETAKIGTPVGVIDDVVRTYYESLGYGPNYRLPGLSHRTGHGIGLDGHEPAYLVHGDETPLAPGMCFSDEPGIYIPGEFGIRLEDCWYMTDQGPTTFTQLSPSIDTPI